MAGSGISVRRAAWAAVALVASTLLLTVGASPAHAGTGVRAQLRLGHGVGGRHGHQHGRHHHPRRRRARERGRRARRRLRVRGQQPGRDGVGDQHLVQHGGGANPRLVTVTPDGKRAWVMGFGGTSDDDFADAEAMAAIVRITSGNFRLLDRLLSQVARLVNLNRLHVVTEDVVNTARSMLVVGT